MADTRPSLSGLPTELLDIIVTNLDNRKDLKNLRLTCHNLNDVSAAALFQEIMLVPMQGCVKGFASLLNSSPYLAAFVRTLHYNEAWYTYIRALPETEKLSNVKKEMLEGVRYEGTEIALLRSILRLLPDLRAVYLHQLGRNRNRVHYRYPPKYLQRCFDSLETDGSIDSYVDRHPRHRLLTSIPILEALALESPNLATFSATDFDPGRLVNHKGELGSTSAARKMVALLPGLKHLDLSFENHLTSAKSFPEGFAPFIRAAKNLESLTLNFNGDWDVRDDWVDDMEQHGFDQTRLLGCLNQADATLASMTTLTISNVVCKQDDLESFLFRHSRRLRSLTLKNVALTRTALGFSCGIQMLKNLRNKMQLDHFTMKGNLNNTGVQNLLFDPGDSLPYMVHGKLRQATEAWVTGRTADMPGILQRVAIQPGKDDLELPRLTEDEIIQTGLYAILPNLRSVESERAQAQQWVFPPHMHAYPNLDTNQDPIDWLADEMEAVLGETTSAQEPDPDRDEWTERFLQTYPDFNGTCSDEEFDRMAEAMEAAALAETLEEDSDGESYFSASEDV